MLRQMQMSLKYCLGLTAVLVVSSLGSVGEMEYVVIGKVLSKEETGKMVSKGTLLSIYQ